MAGELRDFLTPQDLWDANRASSWRRSTIGICAGYVQANLAIVQKSDAFDFLRFCQRNPKPCPVLEVCDAGDPEPKLTAPGADLRTDLPRYSIYRKGRLDEERDDIVSLWNGDMVAFLLGCSLSFEHLLISADIPIRHLEQDIHGPAFVTSRHCVPAGRFHGRMVASMRPIPAHQIDKAVAITAAHPEVHGGPIHIGDPAGLGISDIDRPDWGTPVRREPGDVLVFWACGITPQQVALEAGLDLMITHKSGHMFVTSTKLS